MAVNKSLQSLRPLSLGAIFFGLAGGALSWWLPLGMVFSLTGLVLAFIDWVSVRRSVDFRLSIAGMVISVATLALCIVIAALGMQTVTFMR